MENSSKRIHKDAKVVECKLMQHMGNVLSRLIITNIIYIPTHPQFRNHFCFSCPIITSYFFAKLLCLFRWSNHHYLSLVSSRFVTVKFISFHSKLTNRITITERYRCRASKQSVIRFIEITSYITRGKEGRKEETNRQLRTKKTDGTFNATQSIQETSTPSENSEPP